MSINPEFKPLDDFYIDDKKELAHPQLPIEARPDNPGELLIPNSNPTLTVVEPKKKASYLEGLGHAFTEYNEFCLAGKFLSREAQFIHPANDLVPDDFNPRDLKHLKNYPSEYWDFIAQGESPNDIAARQTYVDELVHEKEYYNNGSWSDDLIGGFAAALTSPSSALYFANSVKYASISQATIKGALEAVPEVALQVLSHEGFKEATEAGSNLENLAINSLMDAMYGVAFMGAGAGLGAAFRGGKLWNVRKAGKFVYEGVDFGHVIDPKNGGVTGEIRASAASGISVSAATLDQAQAFADSAMHAGFLFAVPGMQKLAGNKYLGSPIVKGYSSSFNTIREFTDKMSSNSIITKYMLNGEAKPDSAEDILSAYNAGAANFTLNYKGHFYEQNGIEGGFNVRNATKTLVQKATKKQSMSEDEFGYLVSGSIINKEYNQSKSINAAAELYAQETDKIWVSLMESKGLDPTIPAVKNAKGYYTFTADTIAITKRPQEFRDVAINAYEKQDQLIEEITRPINEAQAFLDQLKAAKLTGKEPNRALVNEIKEAEVRLKEAQRNYEERARSADDENIPLILEDTNHLTLEEAEQLRGVLKFKTESLNSINQVKTRITKLKKSHSSAKSKAIKNKTDEATNANLELMRKLASDIKVSEKELHLLENSHEEIIDELEERARTGIINPKFFTKDGAIITFRNPEEWAKFRKPYGSYEARYEAAEALRQTYLNQTTEQVQQSILGSMMPGLFANPLKKRTSMIPMKDMHDARFINTNVPQSYSAYSRTMGRHIALNTVFKHVNLKEGELGPVGITRVLSEERNKKEHAIDDSDRTVQEKEKARVKLEKEFQEAQRYAHDMYKIFMGQTDSSPGVLRTNRALKNYAAATKLGGVPIALLTDTGAIILKHGIWPYFRSGLKPMIETLNGYLDTELAEDLKANAANAHLSLQHLDHGYSQKYTNAASVGDIPIGTHLESGLQKFAHLSGNFYGTNFVENYHQRQVATIMQSEIMQHLYSYKAGKLTKTNELKLLSIGIKPKEWAHRMISSFENSSGYKDSLGAYQSKYWLWEDNAAINRMAMSIRRGVYDTIVQRGLFTSPFWTNNPILGSLFMFHGWAFAAFTRYTVPVMQRMDADKVLGILTMLAIGSQTDPLRKLANGKKFDTENDDTWFGKAFTIVSNSGVLGHTTDMLQTFNKLVDGHLLPSMSERYHGWNKWSTLGPIAGIFDDYVALYKMSVTQNWNKDGIKRTARLVPGAGSIPLRRLLNKYIDGLELPETYGQAKRENE